MLDAESSWPIGPCPGQSHGILDVVPQHRGHDGTHPTGDSDDSSHRCETTCTQGFFFALAVDLDSVDDDSVVLVEGRPIALASAEPALRQHRGSPQPRGPPA